MNYVRRQLLIKNISTTKSEKTMSNDSKSNSPLDKLNARLEKTLDTSRTEAAEKRHNKGYRTARENLEDLCDANSFIEYGQLAVAAQRKRRSLDDLQTKTAADGVITGLASINADLIGVDRSQVAVVVNDYSVLAGTQGFFHHKKLDRIIALAEKQNIPIVMYTEGGGGLGAFAPTEIGPTETQSKNGVIDIVAENELEATRYGKKCWGFPRDQLMILQFQSKRSSVIIYQKTVALCMIFVK